MFADESRFVSFDELLAAPQLAVPQPELPQPERPSAGAEALVVETPDQAEAARDARVFRAALADAFAACLTALVRDLAADVLARELRLAPADIAALAQRMIAERLGAGPVRLRVASADAAIVCAVPVVVDPALLPGDAVLDCAQGTVDARLGVRLASVIAALTA